MKITRRDLLTWGGGLTAGMLATPVPWKLLDDSAKWTQNWPWIPQPARAPIEVKPSFCSLCPRGCGVQVRMAAGSPVGITGMPQPPVNRGALCPLAFGAHQLNWHPRRLRRVLHGGRAASWNDAQAAFRKACAAGPIMIVDGWQRRAASAIFEEFAKRQGGAYRSIASAEERSLEPYAEWSGVPAAALGYDLENARTVVSFGAPLLDGWGAPGRVTRIWSERAAGMEQPEWRLIQAEPSLSRSAACGWCWVAIKEESEPALASGLARVLLEERLVRSHGPMPRMSLAECAAGTGLSEEAIRELARVLVERGPALAIAPAASPAVAALNVVLGAVGARGGVVRRSSGPARPANSRATEACRAVLIDSTVPWDFKPWAAAETFRFAAWDGGGHAADWLLPAPGLFEELTDIPTAPGSTFETYAIAEELTQATHEVQGAASFLAAIDPKLPAVDAVIRARCRRLPTSQSPEKFEEALRHGAVWRGPAAQPGGLVCRVREWPAEEEGHTAVDWTAAWTPPVLPPLATKLYRDSRLREVPGGREI